MAHIPTEATLCQADNPGSNDYDLKLKDGGRVEFRNGGPGTNHPAKAIVDPYGQRTTLEYDAVGRLSKITEPAGRYLVIHYRTYPKHPAYPGSVVEVIDKVEAYDGPQARLIETVLYSYEPIDTNVLMYVRFYNLTGASYDDGTHAIYHYSPPFLVTPGDNWTLVAGKVETCQDVRYTGAMSNIRYEYTPRSNNQAYPLGVGQINAEKNMTNGGPTLSSVTYPAVAGPCTSTNLAFSERTETRADGATRKFQYDCDGELLHYTDFAKLNLGEIHHKTIISYTQPAPNSNGNHYLRTEKDARNNDTSTEMEYNIGAVMAVIHPDLSRIEYAYTDPNNPYYLVWQEDENDHKTHFDRIAYSALSNPNRVWRIRYPDGGWEEFAYNTFGQVLTHRMTSSGEEVFEYDNRGLKTAYTPPWTLSDPDRHKTLYFYYGGPSGPGEAPEAAMRPDVIDRLRRVIDPRGNSTWFEYNSRGQVTRVTHQDSNFKENFYNPDGTLQWTEDELGHRTSYLYDEYKRITKTTNAVQKETHNSYSPWNGHGPLSHTTSSSYLTTLPSTKKIKHDYDSNFRLVETIEGWETPDSATTTNIYDAVGNLWKVTDPKGQWSGLMTVYGYNNRNRRESVTDALGKTTQWLYDDAGNMKKETRADNKIRTWDLYDAMNRVKQAYFAKAGLPSHPAAGQMWGKIIWINTDLAFKPEKELGYSLPWIVGHEAAHNQGVQGDIYRADPAYKTMTPQQALDNADKHVEFAY